MPGIHQDCTNFDPSLPGADSGEICCDEEDEGEEGLLFKLAAKDGQALICDTESVEARKEKIELLIMRLGNTLPRLFLSSLIC